MTHPEALTNQQRYLPMDITTCMGGSCVAHTDGVQWQIASDQNNPTFAPAVFPTAHAAWEAKKAAEFLVDQWMRSLER
uniref:Uncharacterized protein n=1 Tax=viral metagenome TaxID=1070528 RepID=A0A6M3LRD6_9ZZZZ